MHRDPGLCKAVTAAWPTGNWGAGKTTVRTGLARLANPVMWRGFPAGTTICRTLLSDTVAGPSTTLWDRAILIAILPAEANRSAGAPCSSWSTWSGEWPRFRRTVTPGWARTKA